MSDLPERAPLSVVIPTKDRPELLADCLRALAADLRPEDEVLVVDSASVDDRTAETAAAAGVRCLRAPRPGSSLARNVGWQNALHDAVAFVDDDIRVLPGWADAMAAALARTGVDLVTGRIELAEGEEGTEHPVSVMTDDQPARLDRFSPGVVGASANLAVRRAALVAVHGFDERLGPGTGYVVEDLDLFDRLFAAGYVGRYEPAARVVHVQWRVGGEHLRVHWGYGKGMGARLGKLAWHDRARARRLAPEVLRLRGVATAVSEVRERRRRSWGPPVVWRLGALVGFVVGLVRLRRDHWER